MGVITRLRDWFGPIDAVVDSSLPAIRYDPAVMQTRAASGSVGVYLPKWSNNQPSWYKPAIETYDHEGFRKVALIFRCVQYVANAAGSAPLRVYRSTANQLDEESAHPFRQLITKPNPMQGEVRFISFVAMVMQVAGFALIEKERDRLGNVIGLWALRSDWARPIPRGHDPADWEYRVPGYAEPFILAAEDVIPITYADTPDNSLTGIGPLEIALREVGIANSLTDFLKAFLDRGAMPMYMALPSDDPDVAALWQDQGTADAFREKFQQRFGGLSNAVDIGIFGGIKDVKQLGFNFDELAYPELRNLTDNAICAAFGVSPILVDAQGGLQNSTYNNKIEARRGFYEDFMTGLWARIDDAFTRQLLPELETNAAVSIQFDVSEIPALKEDEDGKWTRATAALHAGGIMMNDYRVAIGLKPVEGGDVFLIPVGVTPVPLAHLPSIGKSEEPAVTDESVDPNADTTDETDEQKSRQRRSVPDLPGDVIISESDVDDAIASFDEQFPDFAGLLSAEVEDAE